MTGIVSSTVERMLNWAQSSSLWFVKAGAGCCADELMETVSCRYDLERFGCLPAVTPAEADLLVINGAVTPKLIPHIRELYDTMADPKYVLAVGSCAVCGGPFAPEYTDVESRPADQVVPVDVYVAGCPPRPEAIMNGLIELQRKIRHRARRHSNEL